MKPTPVPDTADNATAYNTALEPHSAAAQADLYQLLMQAPVAIVIFRGPDYIIELANDLYLTLAGKSREALLNKPAFEAMPVAASQGFIELLNNIRATGAPVKLTEHTTLIERLGQIETTYLNIVYQPLKDAAGTVDKIMILMTDVTDQVIARKKTEDSEELLRIAIEGGELGTYDFYPQTDVLFWSHRTKELFGLPPDAVVTYDLFLKGVHPDDRERTHAAVHHAMKPENGGLYDNEYRTIGITDGKLRWVRSKGKISFDDGGKPVRFTGVMQEITKQKEALRSLQLQSLVLERMDEGVSVSDAAGIIQLTNAAEDRMFGYEPGELIGKHVTVQNHYSPEENERIVSEVIAELKSKGFWNGEWHNRKKDGTPFFTYSYITRLEIDGTPLFVCVQRDITEEKAAKEALAYHTALLEAHHQASPDGILLTDRRGNIIYYNQRFIEIWNMPQAIVGAKNDEAALSFATTQLVHPQQFIEKVAWLYEHPTETSIDELEFKNGSTIERYGYPVVGDDGTFHAWSWTFRDITPHQKAQEELNYQKQLLETVTENTSLALFLMNEQQHCIYMNEAAEEMTGYKLAEVQGKSLHYYIHHTHPDGRHYPLEECPIDQALPTHKRMQGEETFVHKDGRFYPVAFTASPIIVDGKPIGTVVEVRNTAEEKAREQAIRQSEEKFRMLTEALPQLVWMTDAQGAYEYASNSWKQYTDLDPKDYTTWRQIVHPEDMQNITNAWMTSLETGGTYRAEVRLRSKHGVYRWHLVNGEPIRNEAGTIVKWIGAFTDIHLQKTEAGRLEAIVQQRTRELQRSNDDLQQFAHVASHDLKEPVRKIRTFGSRLSAEFGDALPEKAKLYIEKMESAAARMYAMIDGVLNYSTVSTVEQTLEAVNLNELVRHIEGDLEVAIQQKGAVITYENLPTIEGSEILLHQLFYNLIYNSLKFSKEDTKPLIRLNATERSGSDINREWGLNREVDYVQLSVQDNGIGFSQDQAERIFKTFTRLNARDQYEGTGLGLALCKKIVERHNGVISAAGMEGMGAIFKIVLPLQQSKTDPRI